MRYIAGSSTWSTKELSIHLTKIMSAVKEGQHKYCETVYSRSGINHMWILKNSKDLLDNLKSRSFSQVSSLKQCPSKGDKYVIDEELQHTDHLFLGVACFTFMNFV
jgi:hypothetical protein